MGLDGASAEGYVGFRGYRTWYRIMGEPADSPGRRPLVFLEAMAGVNRQVFTTMWGPAGALPLGALRDWSVVDRLGEIQVPTLVANGRYDDVTPLQAGVLADGLPDSRRVIFEQAAHLPIFEEPAAFKEAVLRFLQEVDPREPTAGGPGIGGEQASGP